MIITKHISRVATAAVISVGLLSITACTTNQYAANQQEITEKYDIVDTAVNAGSFKTLVTAIQAAGLEDTLRSDGPFTVFAPTDAAFAKLPAGTVESLLLPENKSKLVSVLTYHVLPGAVKSSDIAGKKLEVATVEGSNLSVDATNGVMVDNAKVVTADIETSNGVIHVIDTVIMP